MKTTVITNAYRALALQLSCHAVNQASNRQEARTLMRQTIDRLSSQIAASITRPHNAMIENWKLGVLWLNEVAPCDEV